MWNFSFINIGISRFYILFLLLLIFKIAYLFQEQHKQADAAAHRRKEAATFDANNVVPLSEADLEAKMRNEALLANARRMVVYKMI